MLAIDLAHEDRLVALMDIGTNTELIVGNKHRILAASCPAGPAFEGGAIACGMPGLEGAIESVALSPDGSCRLGVIGNSAPEGICGSGLVDLMSELVRLGGPSCLAGDIIGDYRFAERPVPGQRIAFLDQAHYSMVKTTTFNGVPLPAIALWDSRDNSLEIVREFGWDTFRDRLS